LFSVLKGCLAAELNGCDQPGSAFAFLPYAENQPPAQDGSRKCFTDKNLAGENTGSE